jgi:hypothetical protein
MSMAEEEKDDKPFLSRWSERKRRVRAEEELPAEARDPESEPAAPDQGELEANRAAAEAIDLETLTDRSDYAPFLRRGVPAALKRAALRKLWRSNPVFAVLDGLNDHDLDYRWPGKDSEVVRTAWKVGRGFLTDEDQASATERAAEKPVGSPLVASIEAEAEEAKADPQEAVPEDKAEPREAAEADPPEEETAPESERAKVGLARRLDFAAFAKETRQR